jgi:hypothetical protein
VSDRVTGLLWEKGFDLGRKQTFEEAKAGAAKCKVGGQGDWRLPTIKELYSLIDFSGGMASDPPKPYLDTRYFEFVYGDTAKGERPIDAQHWSATLRALRARRGCSEAGSRRDAPAGRGGARGERGGRRAGSGARGRKAASRTGDGRSENGRLASAEPPPS